MIAFNVVLYSTKNSVVSALKKTGVHFKHIRNSDEIYDVYKADERFIVLFDIDSYKKDFLALLNELEKEFVSMYVIVLTAKADLSVGSALLKRGVKGYLYSYTHKNNILQALEVVSSGNIWLYPEMMRYIMQKLPEHQKEDNDSLFMLNEREKKIAEFVSLGNTNKEIAQLMDLAEVTIKKTLTEIYKKLDVKDRVSLALKIKS